MNIKKALFTFLCLFSGVVVLAQEQSYLVKTNTLTGKPQSIIEAKPLDQLSVLAEIGKKIAVQDGAGKIYVVAPSQAITNFIVSGALGKHTVTITDKKNKTTTLDFTVDATTSVADNGYYESMFDLFYNSMQTDTGSVKWNGDRYRFFVPWGLDHFHTMKGLKYFYGCGEEFVELMRKASQFFSN